MIFQYISIWSVCNYIVKYCDMSATPLSIYFMLVDLRDLPLQVLMGSLRRNLSWYSWWNRSRSLVLTRPALRKSSRCSRLWRLLKLQQLTPVPAVQGWKRYFALQDPHFTAISEGFPWFSILTTSCFVFSSFQFVILVCTFFSHTVHWCFTPRPMSLDVEFKGKGWWGTHLAKSVPRWSLYLVIVYKHIYIIYYIYIYIEYIYIYISIYTHTHNIHIYIHNIFINNSYVNTHTYIYICIYTYTHTHTCTHWLFIPKFIWECLRRRVLVDAPAFFNWTSQNFGAPLFWDGTGVTFPPTPGVTFAPTPQGVTFAPTPLSFTLTVSFNHLVQDLGTRDLWGGLGNILGGLVAYLKSLPSLLNMSLNLLG